MKFDDLLSFIAKHPKSCIKLKSLQIILRQLLFDQRRCNEIYNRRNNILYRESYYKTNHQKLPKENCSNYLYRIFITHDPYPYRYDYEIIPTIEKSKINVLTSYYKITYYFNGYLLDNRPIKSVKETGEVKSDSVGISVSSHTNGMCGPGSGQVANNPCTSRSRLASRSRANSYATDDDENDNNDNNNPEDKYNDDNDDLFISQNNNVNISNHSTSNNSNSNQSYPLALHIGNNNKEKKISINSKSILTNYSSNATTTNYYNQKYGGSENDKPLLSPSGIKPSLLLSSVSSPQYNNFNNEHTTPTATPTGTTMVRNRVVKVSTNYISPKHNCRDSNHSDSFSPDSLPNFIPEDETM